jgi:hypothetical protein
MRILARLLTLLLALALIPFVQSCMDDTPPEPDHNNTGEIVETLILPSSPTTVDQVKFITHDCKYYVLASVTQKAHDIQIKKRFNSQMKWPCVMVYDTISLGQLKQGNYSVTFKIVDTNPTVTDSISYMETLSLKVEK